MSAAIATAAAARHAAELLHGKTVDALDAAKASVPEPADVQALTLALEDISAAHALGETSTTAVAAARRALADAQGQAGARADALGLVNGLQRRLQSAQTALSAARALHEHLAGREHEKPGAFAALVQRMRAA